MLGHGGSDVGATYENRYEKDDTLQVTKLIKKKLEDKYSKKPDTRQQRKCV